MEQLRTFGQPNNRSSFRLRHVPSIIHERDNESRGGKVGVNLLTEARRWVSNQMTVKRVAFGSVRDL